MYHRTYTSWQSMVILNEHRDTDIESEPVKITFCPHSHKGESQKPHPSPVFHRIWILLVSPKCSSETHFRSQGKVDQNGAQVQVQVGWGSNFLSDLQNSNIEFRATFLRFS